ncbi:DUF5990 family protein [Streptomyces sp. H27-C3]|uniref:DUF5990 family protein n=1 Tax=Streptomyces sp. H27-C3 TaxID=3046305 RepID=UPI0024B99618|nr:DUF5990 family protein [Streptomyces sp. H27-C3]MDJ0466848.1 DUF5990 family protein [Streptomyces sp. H27-C3]
MSNRGATATRVSRRITLRIVGSDLPGASCGEFRHVHVGTQRGREPDQVVSADEPQAVFEIPVEVLIDPQGPPEAEGVRDVEGASAPAAESDPAADFRGPYVQGRPGARFVYLTWGEQPPGGEFTMFRRIKLFLADLPTVLIAAGGVLEGTLGLTDDCGLPLCAAVRPPRIAWSAGTDG